MPFKSKAQRRYLYLKHPKVAKEFEAETPKGSKLPEKKKSPWINMKTKKEEDK